MLNKIVIGLSGLLYLAFGFILFFNPFFLQKAAVILAEPTAITEIRAFYGGLEIGLGVFVLSALPRRELHSAALLLLLLTSTGLLLGRAYGAAVDGVEGSYLYYALAFELPLWSLAASAYFLDWKKNNG